MFPSMAMEMLLFQYFIINEDVWNAVRFFGVQRSSGLLPRHSIADKI